MSEPAETPKAKPPRGRRRKGQKPVKVVRKSRARPAPKSLEEVVHKHARKATSTPQAATSEPEAPPPPIEEVVRSATLDGHVAVPPAESDPHKRDTPSLGWVEFTPDAPDLREPGAKPHSLEDLMAIFPVGIDSQYYIHVVRKGPKSWAGYKCSGIMRPIRESMTTPGFEEVYGGGDYVLTVYGPPKRGGQLDPVTQRVRPKALTGNVVFTVPYGGAFGIPPNPDAAFEEETDGPEFWMEDEMHSRHRGNFPRTHTPADASMHKASLEHDREWRRDQAAERRAHEERLRELEEERIREKERAASMVSDNTARMMELMAEHSRDREEAERKEKAQEMERRQRAEERLEAAREAEARRQRDEHERLMNKPTQVEDFAKAMTPLMEAVRPKGEDGELRALRSELKTTRDAHDNEIRRINEQHANELKRERDGKDEVRKLADERVKDVRESMERRIREVEERAERDVKRAQEDGRQRVEDMKQIYEGRLRDEEKNHRRELESVKNSLETRVATEKTVATGQTKILEGELARERANAQRFESEAREKGDLVKQVGKFSAAAEALGFQRAGEGEQPGDWKQTLAQVGLNLAQNFPEILRNAGEAVAGAKSPHVQVVQQPGMLPSGYGPPQQLAPPMGFGTEEGPEYEGEEWAPVPQQAPPPAPAPPAAPEPIAQQVPAVVPPSPAPHMPHAAPPATAAPTTPLPPPGPSPARGKPRALKPPPPAAEPMPSPVAISDEMILSFQPPFEEAFRNRMPPEEFAAQLAAEHGQTMVQTVAASLTPQMVMKALMSTPAGSRSPLVRGAGQRYLHDLLTAIRRAGG